MTDDATHDFIAGQCEKVIKKAEATKGAAGVCASHEATIDVSILALELNKLNYENTVEVKQLVKHLVKKNGSGAIVAAEVARILTEQNQAAAAAPDPSPPDPATEEASFQFWPPKITARGKNAAEKVIQYGMRLIAIVALLYILHHVVRLRREGSAPAPIEHVEEGTPE